MINKYLNADPIPWLTDGTDPAATYLAKKEFLSTYEHNEIYHELEASALTGYFRITSKRNILGDKNNPDLVNRGTVWFFLWAVECGYDSRTDFIRETSAFIYDNLVTPEGGYTLSLQPRVPLACRTGDVVRAMIKSGINNEKTVQSLKWITDHQRHDGGWLHCPFSGFCDVMRMFLFKKPGKGIKREYDNQTPSCPVATLSCLRALSASGNTEYKRLIETGAEYIIKSSVLSMDNNLLYCGLNTQPQKCGYPVMSQFDPITALREIYNTSLWNDPMCAVSFNNIMKRQTSRATWKLENNKRGMIPSRTGENRLVTLNVLRLLKRLAELEG